MTKRSTLLLSAVALAMTATGCAQVGHAPQASRHGIEGDLAKVYRSLHALKHDSGAIVIASAETAPRSAPRGQGPASAGPATITVLHVDRLLWGSIRGHRGSQIVLRQDGSPTDERPGFSPLPSKGRRYLLFLTPFEFHHGKPNGQYAITGDSGEFLVNGDRLNLLSPEVGPAFPKAVTMASLGRRLSLVGRR